MTREESWNAFIDELRAYVREHHHFPNKHTNLLSRVKYVRKKINDGTLEEWKKEMFLEVADMRDMEEHCGGRRSAKRIYLIRNTMSTEKNNEQQERTWICSVCGYEHVGAEPPKKCPKCGVDGIYFDPVGE